MTDQQSAPGVFVQTPVDGAGPDVTEPAETVAAEGPDVSAETSVESAGPDVTEPAGPVAAESPDVSAETPVDVAGPDVTEPAEAVDAEGPDVPAETPAALAGAVPPAAAEPVELEPADGETAPVAVEREPLPDVPLQRVLEALLLVTDEPVPATTLAQVSERPVPDVERVLAELVDDYERQGRGFELRLVAGGWRLYTRADCAPYVERFLLDGQQARLTQAALETLAVVAYRQPVTRSRVSAVRGVNVDGVMRTLQARGLVADAGQDPDSAATLYRTTPLFLERLGLQSLDDLPALAPLLPELDELDDASTST